MTNKKKRNINDLSDDEPYLAKGSKTGRYYWTTKNKERKASIRVGYFNIICGLALLIGIGYALFDAFVSVEGTVNRIIILLLTLLFEGWGISSLIGMALDIRNDKEKLKNNRAEKNSDQSQH